jgi:hypothetical protein
MSARAPMCPDRSISTGVLTSVTTNVTTQAAQDRQFAQHHLAQGTSLAPYKEGDRLFVIETRHGVMVTPYDPQFERTMQNPGEVIERFKHAYKLLADR